jgi:hypothetical protein
MRYWKRLGLVAVAATTLTAISGVGGASATTLCTTADSPGCTMTYTTGTTIDFSLVPGGTTRITSPPGVTVLTCTESTIKGKTTQTSGTWIEVDIEAFTRGGCNATVDTIVNGKLEIMWTSGNNAEVVGKEAQVTTIIGGVSCTYGFGEGTKLGTLMGGEAPTLKIETKIKKVAGSFACPAEPIMDAEYVLTEPHALFAVN